MVGLGFFVGWFSEAMSHYVALAGLKFLQHQFPQCLVSDLSVVRGGRVSGSSG